MSRTITEQNLDNYSRSFSSKNSLIIFFVFVVLLSAISLFQTNREVSAQESTITGNATPATPGGQVSTMIGNVTGFLSQTVKSSAIAVKDIFGDGGGGLLVLIIIAVIAIPVITVALSKSRGRHHAIESPTVVSDHKETRETSQHVVKIKTEGGLE